MTLRLQHSLRLPAVVVLYRPMYFRLSDLRLQRTLSQLFNIVAIDGQSQMDRMLTRIFKDDIGSSSSVRSKCSVQVFIIVTRGAITTDEWQNLKIDY